LFGRKVKQLFEDQNVGVGSCRLWATRAGIRVDLTDLGNQEGRVDKSKKLVERRV